MRYTQVIIHETEGLFVGPVDVRRRPFWVGVLLSFGLAIGATGGHCDATEFPPSIGVPSPQIANGTEEIRAGVDTIDHASLAEGKKNGVFQESLDKERKIGLQLRRTFRAALNAGVNGDNVMKFGAFRATRSGRSLAVEPDLPLRHSGGVSATVAGAAG